MTDTERIATRLRIARNSIFDLAVTICTDCAERGLDAADCATAIRFAQRTLDHRLARTLTTTEQEQWHDSKQ